MTFLDSEHREIITKAVCGNGNAHTNDSHSVLPYNQPTSILGCWVINHRYEAMKKDANSVEIHGSFDMNIWYSYHDNTKTEVVNETVSYCDNISLSTMDHKRMDDDYDIIAKVTQQPNCLECKIVEDGDEIVVDIERGFTVQIIGETKIVVKVDPYGNQTENGIWSFTVTDNMDAAGTKLERKSNKE
ncbi:MAG TPA: outer spore coat protein CotE [Bacillota bacterium]|nr:outer spore coat protein CotE [Bacillota bacterium]